MILMNYKQIGGMINDGPRSELFKTDNLFQSVYISTLLAVATTSIRLLEELKGDSLSFFTQIFRQLQRFQFCCSWSKSFLHYGCASKYVMGDTRIELNE